MELSIHAVARLLGETEATIYRWARQGSLPAHRIHDQYWFNRVDLQEWATQRHQQLPASLFSSHSDSPRTELAAAVERGGIYYQVEGRTKEEVLASIVALSGIPQAVNRSMLWELLISREKLASTGVGDGIAIPHPREPVVVSGALPTVLLCFLKEPVDFHALDGKPVSVVFTLLSPTVPSHLQSLSKIAAAVHNPLFREMLRTQAPAEGLLTQLQRLEQQAAWSKRASHSNE